MVTSRAWAGRSVTSSSPIHTRPALGTSSPATTRSVVVLPQPDGPSSVRNSPGSRVRETSSTATVAPNRFVIPAIRTRVPPAGLTRLPPGASGHSGARARARDPGWSGRLPRRPRRSESGTCVLPLNDGRRSRSGGRGRIRTGTAPTEPLHGKDHGREKHDQHGGQG